MKKYWKIGLSFLLALLFAVSALMPVLADETPETTEEPETTVEDSTPAPIALSGEGITDHLETAEDVKWYSLELSSKGAILVTIQSLQERWTGYTYYWYAMLYASDMETVVAEVAVGGANYMTSISASDLEPGTYYLKINSVAHNNPMMAGFTDASYQLTPHIYDYSAAPAYEKDRVLVLSRADDFICQLGDVYFYKLNDGEAFIGLYTNKNGRVVPFLFSETKEAVEFFASDGTWVSAYDYPFEYNGKEYYYSNSDIVKCETSNEKPFYYSYAQNKANSVLIEDILEKYEDDQRGGIPLLNFIADYWIWILVVGGIALLIVLAAIKGNSSEYSSSSSSTASTSSYGTDSYGSSGLTAKQIKEWEEMEIDKTVINHLKTPGYDTESFGPDVETFPTDIDSFPPSSDM